MKRFAIGSVLLLLTSFECSSAQSLEELIESGMLPPGVVISGDMPTPAKPPAKGEKPAAKESERAKKLKKLEFDRRPSAVLREWSTPPKPEEPEEKPEEKPEQEPAAKPMKTPATDAGKASEESAPSDDESTDDKSADDKSTDDSATDAGEGEDEAAAAEESAPSAEEKAKAEAAKQEAEAKKKAAEAKKKAEAAKKEAERKAKEAKALEAELKRFQRNVTLGEWEEVKAYLAGLDEADAKAGYEQMIKSLAQGPKDRPKNPEQARYAETNVFSPQDVIALAAVAPAEIEKEILNALGSILRQSFASGNDLDYWLQLMRDGIASDEFALTRRQAAKLLFGAGEAVSAGEFLPDVDQAEKDNDREALNLLSRHYLALHAEDPRVEHLEKAWAVTQAALAAGEIDDDNKQEALKRAVDLAPKIREELGQVWLDESFTNRPERGMEILATIGSAVSRGMQFQARNADYRLKGLELQTTAANALLKAAPELATEWHGPLNLMAMNWLFEALLAYRYDASTQRGPYLQRDVYGNFFYYNQGRSRSGGKVPDPITTGELLDICPGEQWLELVDRALRPKFSMVFAQLLLKVGEESEAFPYIEELALTHPEHAKELVDEFLRVWTRNHDQNSDSSRTNRYMFIYGFDQRANGIPLTRSKQQRNLTELGEWVARLRRLPIVEIDEDLLAQAFTTCHSSAEVYRLETIEDVFGSLADLGPKTLAQLVQKMRSNLIGVWRDPATQKDKKTRRRSKDIQAEVLRGYAVAGAVVEEGLKKHPDQWQLMVARAALLHDENNYRQEIESDPEFSGRRADAFALFREAADRYAVGVSELAEDEATAAPYEVWYYAALGACDLNAVDHEMPFASRQIDAIREAIESLGGDIADRHMGMFANSLFTRMSSVNPGVKFRYLRAGLEIVGDHERAREAQDVYTYYRDLVTEIRLETRLDGSDVVGHGEPFGMFVDLVHSREIERESGGFGKYLINQNNARFSWNYGRPTEDYRDKFEETAREALQEHFKVLSITFNHPDVNSIATARYGWRVTPYAYVLLQPRGPEVDRVPPLRLDMDFLDTSGYVVIPIESSPVVIDAKAAEAEQRPFGELAVTQTLDERQARTGKLVLEVKAVARGLVPDLESIVDLSPEEFETQAIEDQGVSVTEFDQEAMDPVVISERTWMITLQGRRDLERLPESFTFGLPRAADAEMEYQRFADADLESVAATITLEQEYGDTRASYWWLLPVGLILAGVLLTLWIRSNRGKAILDAGRFQMPESVTPFTAIGVLRDIQRNNGIDGGQRKELVREIERLEEYYFAEDPGDEPELRRILETWLNRSG